MADKYREVEYILGIFYNGEITKEKSIRKEIKYKQIQGGLKIGHRKVKLI